MKNLKKTINTFIVIVVVFLLPTLGNSSTKTIPTQSIKTNSIGGAYLTIAGKFGGDISNIELKGHYKLGVEGCAKGSLITTYTIEIKSNGKTVAIEENSNVLRSKTLILLNSLKKGDSFSFKNVKAKLPTGNSIDVSCRTFTIV